MKGQGKYLECRCVIEMCLEEMDHVWALRAEGGGALDLWRAMEVMLENTIGIPISEEEID